ncbi:MAG TPA: transglutaminase domain-containing protein, partial [Acidimicrobiales bacterium]
AIFAVSALDSLWLPAAYRPVRITGVHGVRYSAAAGSLIGTKATSDGLTYTVESDVPAAGRAQLEGAAYLSPTAPALQKYLELPTSVPTTVRQIATAVTSGARSPYEAALALQNWLRGPLFRYSLDVPADDGQNALVDFLTRTRAGFCQQFAASFAVLAREVGLPSRVAVGFTPGTLESDGLYHVRDDDAHAWPEVYFAGIGWIAFEPTPGRGSPDPSAQSITGVPPQSPDAGRPSTTPATPPTTVANGAAGPSPASRPRPRLDTGNPAAGTHHPGGSRLDLYVLAALAAALLLWGAALAALQWGLVARRRRHARTPSQRIDVAWARAAEALTTARVPRRPWDTPREYAHRAARAAALPEAAADALAGLAAALSVAAYSPVSPSEADAASAEAAADLIAAAVAADRRWWERAVALVDPRPAWRMAAVRLPRPIARRLSPDA